MSETIFDKIIAGEIPAHKIYEDDQVIAFLDAHPRVEGHTLVVPKISVDHIWDLDNDTYNYLWQTVKHLGDHIKRTSSAERVGVIVEGFGVPHVHIHLLPVNDADEMRIEPDLDSEPDHAKLAEVAEKLRIHVD